MAGQAHLAPYFKSPPGVGKYEFPFQEAQTEDFNSGYRRNRGILQH